MNNKIEFDDYDRITDILMWLGSTTYQLQFTLRLAHKDKAGNRRFFHSEATYGSRYPGVYNAHSIKREMTFYYNITDIKVFASGMILFPTDVFSLIKIIESKVFPWYFEDTSIYKIIKDGEQDRLQIVGKYTPAYFPKDNKFLRFEPIKYTLENNVYMQGVRMFVNTDEEFIDFTLDSFLGFYSILKNTDMYAVASNMATYVKTPPYGINNWSQAGLGSGAGQYQNDVLPFADNQKGNNNFLDNAKRKK